MIRNEIRGGVPSFAANNRMKKCAFAATLVLTTILTALPITNLALAQTAMAPGKGQHQSSGNAQAQQRGPQRPIPDTMVDDAMLNSEGFYPEMSRPLAGGQIQHAWNDSEPGDGVVKYKICAEDCVYKVRVRENMITTIQFPAEVEIETYSLGDPDLFKVEGISANKITISSDGIGNDTNLNLNTSTGNTHIFYIRTEGFNSANLPDLKVRMYGKERVNGKPGTKAIPKPLVPTKSPSGTGHTTSNIGSAVDDLINPKAPAGDFVKEAPFDIGKLHGWDNYNLWGDEELKPKIVYRDEHFTYIDFGDKLKSMKWPTAYVVVDGIDELVNTRRAGNTMIVERVPGLISLKSGKKFLCLEYTGEKP